MIQIGDEVKISLVPKNEAEYPEIVSVKIVQQLPLDDKEVYIAKLLVQTNQDFGYHVGELLLVYVTYENGKMFAYSEKSIQY
jgi:hypothetical protein